MRLLVCAVPDRYTLFWAIPIERGYTCRKTQKALHGSARLRILSTNKKLSSSQAVDVLSQLRLVVSRFVFVDDVFLCQTVKH